MFEDAATDLSALHVKTATRREIFSSRDVPEMTSDKLEGLVILSPTEVALSNDNDFDLGDNLTGEPSMIGLVHLAHPLPYCAVKK